MLEIGIALFIIGGAIIFIGLVIDFTAVDFFMPPAIICLFMSLVIIIIGATVSNETTPNTSATQTTQQIQEQNDINNYNYCPTCGNKIKEN